MRGKNGSKCFYFKACLVLTFTENKKHYLVFGSKISCHRMIEVFGKSLECIFASIYQLLKRNFSSGYSLYFIKCLQVLWYRTVSKCKNECGRMLNPLLLLLDFPFLDHYGKAAESDIPRLAQLPWSDY